MQLTFDHVTFAYHAGSADKQRALRDICLTLNTARILGICGISGSGKSTFIRHLNGILKPTKGHVLIDGTDLHQSKNMLRQTRGRIGMAFQFPERYLFGKTVWDEFASSLEHRVSAQHDLETRVLEVTQTLRFDFARLRDRSPFSLSRSEQRLLGIAVLLVLQPELLVLDEPTAGMDHVNACRLLDMLRRLHQEGQFQLLLVSHDLELLLKYADDILLLHEGKQTFHGTIHEANRAGDTFESVGIGLPPVYQVARLLNRAKGASASYAGNIDELIHEILITLDKDCYDTGNSKDTRHLSD